MDATPGVRQATCTECDNDDATFNVINRDYDMTPEELDDVHITRLVRCDNCKSEGTVSVGYDGTSVTGAVSHEEASWNQDEEGEPTGEDPDGTTDVATGEVEINE